MNIVVFEDKGTEQLFPITTGRPAYAIGCGSFRLIEWLTEMNGHLLGIVRPYLETLQLHDFPDFETGLNRSSQSTWLINARLVPSVSNIKRLIDFRDRAMASGAGESSVTMARSGWAVASAVVPTDWLADKSIPQWPAEIEQLAARSTSADSPDGLQVIAAVNELRLFEYPHQVVQQHLETLVENLEHRIGLTDFRQPQSDVYIGTGITVGQHVVLDSSGGPIVIDRDVKLGPFSLLRGPLYIGPNSKVSEYAAIKDHVAIGHTCKIGGEVEASLIEPFTNKQHHGFLGHSYLGSWINLGAGTCNSDLKNTYSEVNVQYGDHKVSTGMQFFGCVMGDYAKTAINTSIFTGKTIGTASMVYGFATTNVPSFVNYARSFGEIGNLPPAVIVATQKRMFARRKVVQRPCDVQLIHDMFRVTAGERPIDLSDEPLSL